MKFYQRGRGQTQSNPRAERDSQLVSLDRIDALNRTIDYLDAQIRNENRVFSDGHRLGRTGIGRLERQRLVAIRERDQAMEQLMSARTFGTNAPAAGGSRKRRGGTSLMKVGDRMFPISDVDRFCQDNEVMGGLVYEEDGCRATVGVNDCTTAWTILNDVMRRVPSGGKRRTKRRARKHRRTRRRR